MLTEYIEAAMRKAKYENLGNGDGYFATIPRFKGLWANAPSKRECRKELRSVLEGWLLIKLRHNDDDFPIVAGVNLNVGRKPKKVA